MRVNTPIIYNSYALEIFGKCRANSSFENDNLSLHFSHELLIKFKVCVARRIYEVSIYR